MKVFLASIILFVGTHVLASSRDMRYEPTQRGTEEECSSNEHFFLNQARKNEKAFLVKQTRCSERRKQFVFSADIFDLTFYGDLSFIANKALVISRNVSHILCRKIRDYYISEVLWLESSGSEHIVVGLTCTVSKNNNITYLYEDVLTDGPNFSSSGVHLPTDGVGHKSEVLCKSSVDREFEQLTRKGYIVNSGTCLEENNLFVPILLTRGTMPSHTSLFSQESIKGCYIYRDEILGKMASQGLVIRATECNYYHKTRGALFGVRYYSPMAAQKVKVFERFILGNGDRPDDKKNCENGMLEEVQKLKDQGKVLIHKVCEPKMYLDDRPKNKIGYFIKIYHFDN